MLRIYITVVLFLKLVNGVKGLSCYTCNPCSDIEAKPDAQQKCFGKNPTGCSTSFGYYTSAGSKWLEKGSYERVVKECTYKDDAITAATFACLTPSEIFPVGGNKCWKKIMKSKEDVDIFYSCHKKHGSRGKDLNLTFYSFSGCHCDGDYCNSQNPRSDPDFPKPDRDDTDFPKPHKPGNFANAVISHLRLSLVLVSGGGLLCRQMIID